MATFRLKTLQIPHERKDPISWQLKLSRTACPVEATLSLISDKWKILILRDLLTGTKRFGELKKSIGSISQKVLTSNLRAMEDDGLVVRQVYAEVPPRVEYTLTDRGESLRPIIDAMRSWGEEHRRNWQPKRPPSRRRVPPNKTAARLRSFTNSRNTAVAHLEAAGRTCGFFHIRCARRRDTLRPAHKTSQPNRN